MESGWDERMSELNNLAGFCPECKLDCWVYPQKHNPELLLCTGCYKLINKKDFKNLRKMAVKP